MINDENEHLPTNSFKSASKMSKFKDLIRLLHSPFYDECPPSTCWNAVSDWNKSVFILPTVLLQKEPFYPCQYLELSQILYSF